MVQTRARQFAQHDHAPDFDSGVGPDIAGAGPRAPGVGAGAGNGAGEDFEFAARGSVRARQRIPWTVLWVSLVVIAGGLVGLHVAPAMHIVLAVPILIIVAGVIGTLLALVLRRDSSSDRPLGR